MATFDPTQYGATPVDDTQSSPQGNAPAQGTQPQSSSGFDPSQYGATPYDQVGNPDINKTAGLLGMTTTANEKFGNLNPSFDPSTINNPDKIAPYIDNAQKAQADAQQADSEATVGSQIKNGVKDFANQTLKAVGSAVRAPVDIIRSMFGYAPMSQGIEQFGGGTIPSIQSDAANTTAQVYDNAAAGHPDTNASLVGKTAGLTGDALGVANILGAEDVAKGVGTLAEKAAGTDAGKAIIGAGKDLFDGKATNKIIQEVSPRLTPEVAKDATTQTSLLRGKTTIVPTDRIKEMADSVKGIVQGKSFSQDKELVKQAIGNEANNLVSKIEIANHPVPKQELFSAISKAERPVMIASDTTMNNAADKVLNKVSDVISKNTGDVKGSLQGRKEFDKFVDQQFPDLYSSEKMTPMKTMIRNIRSSWNDYIASQLPDDVGFTKSLKKQNLMYDAMDNLAEKAAKGAPKVQGEIGTTRLGRFAEKHPTATKAIGYGSAATATAIGGGEIAKHAP